MLLGTRSGGLVQAVHRLSCCEDLMQALGGEILSGDKGSVLIGMAWPVGALVMSGQLTWLCQLRLRLHRPWQLLWHLLPLPPSAWLAAGSPAAWSAWIEGGWTFVPCISCLALPLQ